jgi:allantoate deiminase
MSQATRQQAADRVMARADALAAVSETPDALTRVYLSTQHLQANQLVGQWMSQAGMTVWQDSVGNICGRYEGVQEGAPAVLLGSHLDTVRNAGRYDGMLGVLTAIEVVDSLHQQGRQLAQAIEIVGFCDEEGTRFGITLLGSRGLTGTWPESWLENAMPAVLAWRRRWRRWGLIPPVWPLPPEIKTISAPIWSCILSRGRVWSRNSWRWAWWKPSTARAA